MNTIKTTPPTMIKTPKTINSLYIHIPFCQHICFYCDFPKVLKSTNLFDKYLDALLFELKSLRIKHKLKTIYIGGGTPTCVNLEKLLIALHPYIQKTTEFTIEGNVLDLNEDLLTLYKSHGVNRLSLGIQSLDDKLLKVLGRGHTRMDAIKKINLAKKYFKNINVDLIYGFNELTLPRLKKELNEYLKLDVPHLSTYSLEIHEGTKFYLAKRKELDSTLVRDQFDLIYKTLTKSGYERYEISNFAKKGFSSKHNLTYWEDEEYYGIGLGAASFIKPYRYKNTLNLNAYINKRFRSYQEKISLEDDKKYYLMLNLRTKDGISLADYKRRFKSNLLIEKADELKKLKTRKLLKINYNNVVATYEGSMLLDIILKELF